MSAVRLSPSYHVCLHLSSTLHFLLELYIHNFMNSLAQRNLALGLSGLLPFLPHSVSSVQFSALAQSCPTLCDPMNCSTPGLPVHHQLPEFTQTHVYRVSDVIQPSHPLSSSSPPALNPSQHQNLFQ